jgi:hypothetical protein
MQHGFVRQGICASAKIYLQSSLLAQICSIGSAATYLCPCNFKPKKGVYLFTKYIIGTDTPSLLARLHICASRGKYLGKSLAAEMKQAAMGAK